MEQSKEHNLFNLDMDETSRTQLLLIAKWINFNAIAGLISLISVIVTFLKLGVFISLIDPTQSHTIGILTVIAIRLSVSVVLNFLLLAAAINIKRGLKVTDQVHFNLGISRLAGYFKVLGLVAIIVLVLSVLGLLALFLTGDLFL